VTVRHWLDEVGQTTRRPVEENEVGGDSGHAWNATWTAAPFPKVSSFAPLRSNAWLLPLVLSTPIKGDRIPEPIV